MLFFCDKAEIIWRSISVAFIRKSAMKCYRSIVLLSALLLCLVHVSKARPAEEPGSNVSFDPNNLLTTLENGIEQASKSFDELKQHVSLNLGRF